MQGITVCRFVLSASGPKSLALEPQPLQTSTTMPSPSTSLSPPIPLSNDKATLLAQLAEGLDGEHLWWLSGYIAGLARAGQAPARTLQLAAAEATTDTGTPATLTIVYGSPTGTAKPLAQTHRQSSEKRRVRKGGIRAGRSRGGPDQ